MHKDCASDEQAETGRSRLFGWGYWFRHVRRQLLCDLLGWHRMRPTYRQYGRQFYACDWCGDDQDG